MSNVCPTITVCKERLRRSQWPSSGRLTLLHPSRFVFLLYWLFVRIIVTVTIVILHRFYVDSGVDSKLNSDGPESTDFAESTESSNRVRSRFDDSGRFCKNDSAVDSALGSAEPVSESMPNYLQNRVSESRLVTATSILADSALRNRLRNRR